MTGSIYGYFDAPEQTEPAFDPGLNVPCPVCHQTLDGDAPIKTISVMLDAPRDNRSYFYRSHKACYDGLTVEQQGMLDWPIIDARNLLQEKN